MKVPDKREDEAERPDVHRRDDDEQSHRRRERVAGGEHKMFFEMIRQPAGQRRARGVENISQQIKSDGKTGGPGRAEFRRQFLRGQQNQQRRREIARAKQADGHEKFPIRRRQRAQPFAERNVRHALALLFLDQKRDERGGEQAGNQRGQKNVAVIVRENCPATAARSPGRRWRRRCPSSARSRRRGRKFPSSRRRRAAPCARASARRDRARRASARAKFATPSSPARMTPCRAR